MQNHTEQERSTIIGHHKFTIRDKDTGVVKRVYEFYNLVPTVGRNAIARALAGDAAALAEIEINYAALGTNGTAPANGNTQLGTEVYRKLIASGTSAANQAFITGFFTAIEVSGTFLEYGLFINGTASANSGVLLSHVNINVTKTTSETMTVDTTFTIT